ncbi:MAG: aspartate aminotransferase family protein [Alphaproteobacteria bacterium]|jgi:4-aminobutyrate---pyruvate transaminase|nr:aspartate aminotransferase family protein [Rhodospirillaceae bacterium]MBT7646527.1 aspartate aminotransferase family protein [Rhodospirillaceae bacterium]MDG2482913.1 aspartate aminotransferase family protein [Alphaproteobacteria bacterium]
MTVLPNSPHARDVASVIHPYTNLKKHEETGPMIIDKGDGIYVEDTEGKRYIEGLAGLWCTSLGFNNERLVEAAANQMRKLPYYHSFFHRSSMPSIDLAERLIEMAPVPMSKVWFANSGSEANDHMMKFVWYYNNARGKPEKKKIIARTGGYHGICISSGSLTGMPLMHAGFDLPIKNVLHTGSPHFYHFGNEGESEEEFATRRANELEELILAEGPETVAGFVAEPVMGAGGVILPPKGYYQKVQAVLDKYDILMIADEVICGFHRTGQLFGCNTYGIKPDIMVVAKQLSSAYLPISAVILNEKVYGPIRDFSDENGVLATGFTYSGHPVPAAVAVETLKIYEEMDIASHVAKVAPVMQERLAALGDHPIVGEARGVGLIGACELVKSKETRENFAPAIASYCGDRCIDHGLILRAAAGNAVAACPPLIITESEINQMFDAFKLALDDTWDYVQKEELLAAE